MTSSDLIASVTRHIPLMSGCGTLAHARFPEPPGDGTPCWMELRTGERVLASPRDYVGRVVHYFGDLDPKVFWVAQRFVRPGDTVLDLGAHIGTFALPAASLVGPGGAVHAWEPQPKLAEQIRLSARANQLDSRLHLYEEALGAENAVLDLHLPADNLGGASLLAGREPTSEVVPVPVRQAAARLKELELGKVAMVKMDVEGFETTVVQSAAPLWHTNPPDVILFEYREDEPFANSDLRGLLAEMEYRFFSLPSRPFFPRLRPWTPDPVEGRTSHDLVAIQQEVCYHHGLD